MLTEVKVYMAKSESMSASAPVVSMNVITNVFSARWCAAGLNDEKEKKEESKESV
jgi:hypothetical protein